MAEVVDLNVQCENHVSSQIPFQRPLHTMQQIERAAEAHITRLTVPERVYQRRRWYKRRCMRKRRMREGAVVYSGRPSFFRGQFRERE